MTPELDAQGASVTQSGSPEKGASGNGDGKRRKRRRRRARGRATGTPAPAASKTSEGASTAPKPTPPRGNKNAGSRPRSTRPDQKYLKRVDEVSAGGLVINQAGSHGLLIGRRDLKDPSGERLLWSLPKGHIESGETPEQAAIREVAEETGITAEIVRELGVIDFWFMAGGKRIHKTVHHYLFHELGGILTPQLTEVDEARWFPLAEIISHLAYPDEKKLIAKTAELGK